ncbi:MAG: SIR2 family protein [Sedimentisphaerales bacterium]
MKIVLFLGAGFSRAWGLPVMKEFFQHAKDSTYLTEEDKSFLRELQSRAQRGVSMYQVGRDNLEGILSFCLAESQFGTGYPDKSNDEYKMLCRILQKVYRQMDFSKLAVRLDNLLVRCWQLFDKKQGAPPPSYELDVITTNYDIMAECCLTNIGFQLRLPGLWLPIDTQLPFTTIPLYTTDSKSVLLCKLHGSLNWYSDSNNEYRLRIESNAMLVQIKSANEYVRFIFPQVSTSDYKPPGEPIIVPPTFFKMQTYSYFQNIWSSAGEMLRKADKLVFIGYSFPDSDVHMRYFLAANLYENVDLRSIDIVDPNAVDICSNLRQSDFGIHFKERLNAVGGKWEENQYCINR